MGFHFVVSIIFFEQQSYNYLLTKKLSNLSCCWYHKGTNFQANHNREAIMKQKKIVVADTTKVRIFKQITTEYLELCFFLCCCWYHKGTNFQANHNWSVCAILLSDVVADTTKVRIFKQITTNGLGWCYLYELLLIPQRYEFSSKSQPYLTMLVLNGVVADTTKVRIFKQITTWR